jgi:hypothetical protein
MKDFCNTRLSVTPAYRLRYKNNIAMREVEPIRVGLVIAPRQKKRVFCGSPDISIPGSEEHPKRTEQRQKKKDELLGTRLILECEN